MQCALGVLLKCITYRLKTTKTISEKIWGERPSCNIFEGQLFVRVGIKITVPNVSLVISRRAVV